MESNVRYAVAVPGILKLWPWVNQVRSLITRHNIVVVFLTTTRTSDAPLCLLKNAPRGCHAVI